MVNQALVLLFALLLTIQCNCSLEAKFSSSVDDVRALLNNLNQTVLGNILAANVQIEDLALEILSFRDNAQLTGELGIQEANQRYQAQLTQIKELAAQDRLNITPCLEDREDKLIELPDLFLDQLAQDIAGTDPEAEQLKIDSVYRVDVIINNVYDIEFQLNRCVEDDADCLSSIVDKIETQTNQLPLQVQSEVDKAVEGGDLLKAKIQDYSDSNVSGFTSEAISMINEIAYCITSW